MAVVRRKKYTTTVTPLGDVGGWSYTFSGPIEVAQDITGAICWRCKRELRQDDALVDVGISSWDTPKAKDTYHRRCIPPVMFHEVAGSLPAWDLSIESSPALAGTALVAGPTFLTNSQTLDNGSQNVDTESPE